MKYKHQACLSCIFMLCSLLPLLLSSGSSSGSEVSISQLIDGCDFAFTGVAGPEEQGDGFFRTVIFREVIFHKNSIEEDIIGIRLEGGTVGNVTVVHTGSQPSFVEGRRYLIFASAKNGFFTVYLDISGVFLLNEDSGGSFYYENDDDGPVNMFLKPKCRPQLRYKDCIFIDVHCNLSCPGSFCKSLINYQ